MTNSTQAILDTNTLTLLDTINNLSNLGTLPTIPTLCFYCGMTKYDLFEHLDVLYEANEFEWIDENTIVSLPKPNWYVKWEGNVDIFGNK